MRYAPVSLCVLLLAGLACPSLALSYTFTFLGTIDGRLAEPNSINDSRQIAGEASTPSGRTAFLWDAGTMTDLAELSGYVYSSGSGINNLGAVVGYSMDTLANANATLWSGGSVVDLGDLGGDYATGRRINSAGDVVGSGWLAGGTVTRGFVYDSGTGTKTVLGTLGTGINSWATDINDAGLVAGYSHYDSASYAAHAFLWDGATMTDLGVPDGHSESEAWTMNNSGVVGGWAETSGTYHGFLWNAGTWTMIGSGTDMTAVTDVNDSGEAVGFYGSETDGMYAFLYSGGSVINLNAYGPAGMVLDQATGINAHGDICGRGMDDEEREFGWLLTRVDESGDVPEPGTFALVGLGLAGLLVARRRRQAA